eukprot:364579-Chlamydomonas_euryale.AAC.1
MRPATRSRLAATQSPQSSVHACVQPHAAASQPQSPQPCFDARVPHTHQRMRQPQDVLHLLTAQEVVVDKRLVKRWVGRTLRPTGVDASRHYRLMGPWN